MTRQFIIERILLLVYGEQPQDNATITNELVNEHLNTAIGIAAKQNYKEAIQLDGIGYVNNSFYTTFKGIAPVADEKFTWKITLPQLPIGIGRNEGVSQLRMKDSLSNISLNCTPLSANQVTYYDRLRLIPNTVLYYPEGIYLYCLSTINLNQYTANITMISGGDSTDLASVLNVPDDFVNILVDYVSKMLIQERQIPVKVTNDGSDIIRTT